MFYLLLIMRMKNIMIKQNLKNILFITYIIINLDYFFTAVKLRNRKKCYDEKKNLKKKVKKKIF